MPTREEFLKLVAMKEEKAKKEHGASLAIVKQVALKLDYVTKNEHWDYYLELLQAKLDEAKVNEVDWMTKCAIANGADDWHVAQRNYFGWQERTRTLEEVMGLPTSLMNVSKESH